MIDTLDLFPSENVNWKTDKGILYCGNALEVLKTFPDESVECVVTSPPYYQLRDYGVESQLGLEDSFREYVSKLLDIFLEVKRILMPNGTCWVNMGDSYMNNSSRALRGRAGFGNDKVGMFNKKDSLVHMKSLCMIPERFAIGMIENGWILRNQIIWRKTNGIPSSVKDRFTTSYEKIFFFVKRRNYYFKQQFEPCKLQDTSEQNSKNKRDVWDIPVRPFGDVHFAVFPKEIPFTCIDAGCPLDGVVLDPFMGSGTTAVVAESILRKWIGIEINEEYCEIVKRRCLSVNGRNTEYRVCGFFD